MFTKTPLQEIVMKYKENEKRLQEISEDTWIDYPAAQEILQQLEELFLYEKNKSRITSILLVGSSNNGKTSLLERFATLHPPYDYNTQEGRPEWIEDSFFEEHSGIGLPILHILAPSEPNESRLYSNILNKVNAPFKERDSVGAKQALVEYYLKVFNIEMLIIDEVHNILSGSIAKQKQIMNAIKNLSNTVKIPVVLAGTKDALRAIETDDQIQNRFRPLLLKKWQMDQDYVNLLATIVQSLTLHKESDILNPQAAQEILKLSEGYIGEIINVIKHAAKYAITSGSEQVTLKEIQECNYIPLPANNHRLDLTNI